MFKKILAIVFAAALLTGCATSGPDKGKVTPQSAAPVVKQVVSVGTTLTLNRKPDVLDEFQMAHKQLTLLEMQSTIDWTSVLVIVNSLPVPDKILKGQEAQLIINSSFMVLNTYANGVFQPVNDSIEDIHVIVKALREGIELGIAAADIQK